MVPPRTTVEDLFEAALPLSPDERARLLAQRCEGAPELRRAIEVLLNAHDSAGSFLEHPLLASSRIPSDGLARIAPALSSGDVFRVGEVLLGRFAVHRLVAHGGMGEVWEAWDAEVQERVALKTIRADLASSPAAAERFRLEVKQARAVSHPNVCRIHELYTITTAPGTTALFLCMEFLDGPTLSEYLRHNGAFPPEEACSLAEQLVRGLSSAHSMGMVHRDFKSQNIMLVSSGAGRMRAVITDFGLALNVLAPAGALDRHGGQGTPDYMAPEQRLTGTVTALADQYSLGVVLCEIITGARPVPDERSKIMSGHRFPPAAHSVPHCWRRVVERCMAADPKDRFPHLDDLLRELKPTQHTPRRWAIAAAVAALLLLAGITLWGRHTRPAEPTSLAVLPIRNESGDSGLEYLSAGFTQALTDDLAQMPGLQVRAGEVVQRYSKEKISPTDFGRELHVSSLVSGAFYDQGDTLRIPVEIIDVESGSELWGKSYEGQRSKLPQLQHEISTDVAYHLNIRLNPDLKGRLKRQYNTVPEAYEAYLKGRYNLAQRSPESLRTAVEDFQHALAADAHYAPAYAGLADSYNLLAHYSYSRILPMAQNALQAANQALALDPTLGEAYASRALARTWLDYDWKGAEADYARAITLNPGYATAHLWYALALLTPQGRDAESQAQLNYQRTADPDSLLTIMSLAMAGYCGQRQKESARILEQHFALVEHSETAIDLLGTDYIALNRARDAIRLLQKNPVADGQESLRAKNLSIAFAAAGDMSEASRWLLRARQNDTGQEDKSPYLTAIYYTLAGNSSKAMDSLEIANERRDPDLLFVNVDPLLVSLHSAPRFKILLQHLHLE